MEATDLKRFETFRLAPGSPAAANRDCIWAWTSGLWKLEPPRLTPAVHPINAALRGWLRPLTELHGRT